MLISAWIAMRTFPQYLNDFILRHFNTRTGLVLLAQNYAFAVSHLENDAFT